MRLQSLTLSNNRLITDKGLRAFCRGRSAASLTELNLYYCKLLTGEGVAELARCPKLKSLVTTGDLRERRVFLVCTNIHRSVFCSLPECERERV